MSEADLWDGQWERRHVAGPQCGFCHANIDDTYGECLWCGWCVDCGEMPGDCHCDLYYSPTPNLDPAWHGEPMLGSSHIASAFEPHHA